MVGIYFGGRSSVKQFTASHVTAELGDIYSSGVSVSRNLELTRYYDLRYPMAEDDLEDYDHLALLTDDQQNSWLNLYI